MADAAIKPKIDAHKLISTLKNQLNDSETELIEAQKSVDILTDENTKLREENSRLWLKLNSLGVVSI